MEICDKAVMDFLAATDVRKFPPGWGRESGAASLLDYTALHCFALLYFSFVSGDEG